MMNKLKTSLSTIVSSSLLGISSLNAQAVNDAYNKTHDSASQKLVPIDSSDDAYFYYLDKNNDPKFLLEFLRGTKDTTSYRLNIYFTDKELGKDVLKYGPELGLVSLNGNDKYEFGLQIKNERIYFLKDPKFDFNDLENYNLIPPEKVFRFFFENE